MLQLFIYMSCFLTYCTFLISISTFELFVSNTAKFQIDYACFLLLILWKLSFRFSSDPITSMGLVQHEGGPCGVLAAIQVMATFSNIAYELVACYPFFKTVSWSHNFKQWNFLVLIVSLLWGTFWIASPANSNHQSKTVLNCKD